MRIATAVLLTTAAFAASATEAPAPAEPQPSRTASKPMPYVDLDKPGRLDQIAAEDPERHRQVLAVLDFANTPQCVGNLQVYKVDLNVQALVSCPTMMLMTSQPPKRRVTFMLNGVNYASNVVQDRLVEPRLRKVEDR